MQKITFDYETKSTCDIRSAGGWMYSKHESTNVLCLAYTIDDGPPKLWLPPHEAVKYIFNVRARHKGLIGHFHQVKGKAKKITKKMAQYHEDRAGDKPNPHPLREDFLLKEWRVTKRGFAWDGDLVLPVWASYPLRSKPAFVTEIIESGLPFRLEAHNAFFEKSIWKNVCERLYDFPAVNDEHWDCSAALAAAHALPRALDKVGDALDLPIKKSTDGKLVMLQLARPKDKVLGTFDHDPIKHTTLYNYCVDDVLTEREVARRLGHLTDTERSYWLLDQKMNMAGIPVDVELITGACKIINDYTVKLEEELMYYKSIKTMKVVKQNKDGTYITEATN